MALFEFMIAGHYYLTALCYVLLTFQIKKFQSWLAEAEKEKYPNWRELYWAIAQVLAQSKYPALH